jgi:hypothetical protein
MATRKGGNGKDADVTVSLLTSIRDEIKMGFVAMGEQLSGVNGRLDKLEVRMERVEVRLDNIRDLAGDKYRDLERRIAALEPGTSGR